MQWVSALFSDSVPVESPALSFPADALQFLALAHHFLPDALKLTLLGFPLALGLASGFGLALGFDESCAATWVGFALNRLVAPRILKQLLPNLVLFEQPIHSLPWTDVIPSVGKAASSQNTRKEEREGFHANITSTCLQVAQSEFR